MTTLKKLFTVAAISLIAVGCTTFKSWEDAQEHEARGDWDRAVIEYRKLLEFDPDNVKYKMALQHASLEASRVHFAKGKELRAAGHPEMAALELRVAVELDPTNQFAAVELAKALSDTRRVREQESRDLEEMKRRVTEASRPPLLNPASNEPISLSFPNTSVKDIYLALGNAFGINVMFDQRLADDQMTIELRDVTAQQALERVMQSAGHFYKVLDAQTIIVVPDNQNTRREYEDLVIRTFYLSNGDAEAVTNVVRSMLEARNVFPLKNLNAITIRDTADKVMIAERIIEANDKAQAEVVVQVELLQIDANKLRDIGLNLSSTTYAFGLSDENGTINSLPINGFGNLGSDNWSVSIPSVSYNLLKNQTEATLLARPQLRISEGEAATLHIGQQVPIAVTTYNSINTGQPGSGNVFAPPTSYQYRDVGIKITIEPRVHHNREITLRLTVEVSNVQEGTGTNDQPTIGTRTIESTIRLKDGETNFLAGLIRRDESVGDSDIPFLSDLPLIGRLFSSRSNSDRTTDLVLTMTPHIIRIPDITEEDLTPMWVGTQSNITFRGRTPRMESQTAGDPFEPEINQFAHQDQFTENPGGIDPAYETDRVGEPIIRPEEPVVDPAQVPVPEEQPQGIPSVRPRRDNLSSNATQAQPIPAPIVVRAANTSSSATAEDSSEPITAEAAVAAVAESTEEMRAPTRRSMGVPRISVQPATLSLGAGEESQWLVVGLDIDDLETSSIIMSYDPLAIDITGVVMGSAVRTTDGIAPVVTIDSETGLITIQSVDGEPIRFATGGEMMRIGVRGVLEGESRLSLTGLTLKSGEDELVDALVTDGEAKVRY